MQKATLKHWHLNKENRLVGLVFGHPKFADGRLVVTSPVQDFHPTLGMVSTMNTIYALEDKAPNMELLLSALEEAVQNKVQPKPATIEVGGGWGTMKVCTKTGLILKLDDDNMQEQYSETERGYKDWVRFDLIEWELFWQKPLHPVIDVLDLGVWLKDGTYSPPEMDWREECIRNGATKGKN